MQQTHLRRALRGLALVAASLALAAFAPGVSRAGDGSLTVGVDQACADGSCAPKDDYICGLNGANYNNKYFYDGGT